MDTVNDNDEGWATRLYTISFGGLHLRAYARDEQEALDECGEWLEEHAPYRLCTDRVDAAVAEMLWDMPGTPSLRTLQECRARVVPDAVELANGEFVDNFRIVEIRTTWTR